MAEGGHKIKEESSSIVSPYTVPCMVPRQLSFPSWPAIHRRPFHYFEEAITVMYTRNVKVLALTPSLILSSFLFMK